MNYSIEEIIQENELNNITFENYENISISNLKKVHKITIKNTINKDTFVNQIKDFIVYFANSSNVTYINDKVIYKDFLENTDLNKNNYIFHNIRDDIKMMPVIEKLIPLPNINKIKDIKDLRIARLYTGQKHTSVNIHTHSYALNYLISGKRIWVIIPNNKENNYYIQKNNFSYGSIKYSALDWFNNNYNDLKNLEKISIFIQNEGEVIYIPNYYHQAVINLEDCIGISYSWEDKT